MYVEVTQNGWTDGAEPGSALVQVVVVVTYR